jgi:hypothetical protein
MRAVRTLVLGLIGLAVFAGSSLAAEDPAALGARLLGEAKLASGGEAWDRIQGWHERGDIPTGRGAATYDSWADVRRPTLLVQVNAEGHTTSDGFDGTTAWSVDGKGAVKADASAEATGRGRRNAYFAMYGFFFPGRFPTRAAYVGSHQGSGVVYDVIAVQPVGGAGSELWLDRNTHLPLAVVSLDKAHPMTTFLADFKVVDGVSLPFTVQQGPDAAHQLVRHVVAYDFDPIPPERFARPLR